MTRIPPPDIMRVQHFWDPHAPPRMTIPISPRGDVLIKFWHIAGTHRLHGLTSLILHFLPGPKMGGVVLRRKGWVFKN